MVGDAKIMAVVKADAYGHGIEPIVKELLKTSVYGFCVALSKEVQELLSLGISRPILHLGAMDYENLDIYYSGQVHCTINSFKDIEILKKIDEKYKLNIHLKIDTGMGRLGLNYSDAERAMNLLNNVNVIGVYSHLATAEDENTSYKELQLNRFDKICELARHYLPSVQYFHIANSSAILTCKDSIYSMVRPGISLYGVSPLGKPHMDLKPIMRFSTLVVLIKKIRAGESVGYGQQYIAEKDETIAIIQAGYADGVPVLFSNSYSVEINNELYPIIGKVSMDLIAIKCNNDKINIGDRAVLWGGKKLQTSLEVVSKKFNRIPYEFLTGITNRVKRNYINE